MVCGSGPTCYWNVLLLQQIAMGWWGPWPEKVSSSLCYRVDFWLASKLRPVSLPWGLFVYVSLMLPDLKHEFLFKYGCGYNTWVVGEARPCCFKVREKAGSQGIVVPKSEEWTHMRSPDSFRAAQQGTLAVCIAVKWHWDATESC